MSELEQREDWRRTSPVAVVFYVFGFIRRLLTDGLPALAPLAAAFAASENLLWSWFGLAALIGGVLLVAWSILSWLRFRFRVADGLVQVRRGVVLRQQLSIDFDRVQNVNIREPFYMRPLGLASLGIDTAGSAGKEVAIAGVAKRLAVELRTAMLATARAAEEHEGAAPEASEASMASSADGETVLLSQSVKAIAIYGLTASTLLWLAVVVGFVFSSAESFADQLSDRFQVAMAGVIMAAANFGIDQVVVVIAVVLGIVLLLPLLSVAGALFRYYGFVLSFDGETYRRSAGLLNRHDESVKQHKIQEVVWKQNLLARWFGRLHLKLAVAQAGEAAQASQSGMPLPGSSFLVPSLTPAQAVELTEHMLEGATVQDEALSRVDGRRFVSRYLLYGWTLPVVAISIAPIALGGPLFALLIPAGLALGALVLFQLWRRLGYAINGGYGIVRTGFLGFKTQIFPLYKVQRVDLRQTPGQRRAGVAHLSVHLASGTHTLPYMPIIDAERLRNVALYPAESDARPWF